jgi:hypothetical protein
MCAQLRVGGCGEAVLFYPIGLDLRVLAFVLLIAWMRLRWAARTSTTTRNDSNDKTWTARTTRLTGGARVISRTRRPTRTARAQEKRNKRHNLFCSCRRFHAKISPVETPFFH